VAPADVELDTIVRVTGDHLTAALDDDVVLLNVESGSYHVLGGAGSPIFRLLEEPRSVRELCVEMLAQFDVHEDVCHRDVLGFVRALVREGLVKPVE
jgi:hypothetical protein